jgi:exodeoxyribonuclease V alpha subunit
VNGDIGLVVHVQEPDGAVQIKIYFPTDDGGRYLTPAELPQIEICYAMTVHKSQGSEYNNLVVILPNESSPLLTRELVYTAITRAKKSVLIAGTEKAFLNSVQNKSVRYSGLGALLKAL